MLLYNFFIFSVLFLNRFKFFSKTQKLLTNENYERESKEFTEREWEKLNDYCESSDCNLLHPLLNLNNLEKFAVFLEVKIFFFRFSSIKQSYKRRGENSS